MIGDLFLRALNAVAAIPRATIAAISGFALGGGCELALACDFRVASERARLGQPEILLGIIPGGGGTQRLPRLVGPARAKDIIFTGRQVGAEEALAIGLVDEVVPPDEVLDRALAKAAELAKGPVVAHGLAKRAIDQGLDITLNGGLDLEQQLFVAGVRDRRRRGPASSRSSRRPGQGRVLGAVAARLSSPGAPRPARPGPPSRPGRRPGPARGGPGTAAAR